MKVSMRWLREWVNPSLPDDAVLSRLTMAGLEIDGVHPVCGKFSNVVIGEILSLAPHPDADKLRICQVAGHPDGKNVQVVCGASNARAGIKIPFALVGAILPPRQEGQDSLEIRAATLRGVQSSGMLCGASELGIDIPGDGLMELPQDAPTGMSLERYLSLDDSIIEINVTPNRGDCLSVRGLSREIGLLTETPINQPLIHNVAASIKDVMPVEIHASEQCPHYVGRIIRNVDVHRPSPIWLRERLRRSGIRSIDAVVDVTNYVLLELGQPMHAFDADKVSGKLEVRTSRAGEKLKLLNGQEMILRPGTLLIADTKEPLAMAGVMGGANSAVGANTQHLLLEAAYFEPLALAGKARDYGLQTDSSQRFERGVDMTLQIQAMERATALLLEIVGGDAGPLLSRASAQYTPVRPAVSLRLDRIRGYLGLDLSGERIRAILEGLGMQVTEFSADRITVVPPGWRFDIRLEVDLLEEIARIHGYDRLPSRACPTTISLRQVSESTLPVSALKQRLTSLGYREVITYSFVDPGLQGILGLADGQIPVQNPISAEMGVMRTSLLPGLVAAARHNLNRQQERVRIFESGLVFRDNCGKRVQEGRLGMLACGPSEPESWSRKSSQLVDFYDIKGDVELLISLGGGDPGALCFTPSATSMFHPGQNALISLKGDEIGCIGMLHPQIQQKLDLPLPLWLVELDLSALQRAESPAFRELSRFPEVRRDLALLVGRDLPVQDLLQEAKLAAGSYLENLKVFDVYSGEGIDPQRKSVGLGLTFRAKSRTLTDSEISESVSRVVEALRTRFQADLRS